jgi:hypothetical protein
MPRTRTNKSVSLPKKSPPPSPRRMLDFRTPSPTPQNITTRFSLQSPRGKNCPRARTEIPEGFEADGGSAPLPVTKRAASVDTGVEEARKKRRMKQVVEPGDADTVSEEEEEEVIQEETPPLLRLEDW